MRLLAVLSGVFLSATGAFCFAFYANRFEDVAFIVGITLLASGGLLTASYLVSGKGDKRVSDTVLVEGLVSIFYAISILSNQVAASGLTLFFGSWLMFCGMTRFSESLYVSRFNTRDWTKILLFAVLSSLVGIVMMLPQLLVSVMPLMLVGGSMLICGLSQIVFAMYMKKETKENLAKGEAEALARAEAKKAAHIAARKEQERLRHLSKEEREKEEQERRSKELQAEQEKRAKRAAEKAARRDASRNFNSESTVRLADEEVEQINAASKKLGAVEITNINDISIARNKLKENSSQTSESNLEVADVEVNINEINVNILATKPVWNKPKDIPSLLAENKTTEKKSNVEDVKINAVKLDEIENNIPIISFSKVELPKVEYASDYGRADRSKIIEKINNTNPEQLSEVQYPEIDLEELVAEPLTRKSDPVDATRFTQKLDFTWIEKINEEIQHKEKI